MSENVGLFVDTKSKKFNPNNMTWREFKDRVESKGVTDSMTIFMINLSGIGFSNDIDVTIDDGEVEIYAN